MRWQNVIKRLMTTLFLYLRHKTLKGRPHRRKIFGDDQVAEITALIRDIGERNEEVERWSKTFRGLFVYRSLFYCC
jgi:hypothetical protein